MTPEQKQHELAAIRDKIGVRIQYGNQHAPFSEPNWSEAEVKFLLALLADAERERDKAENVAAMEHAAGRCVLEACKLMEQERDHARAELAAATERAEQAAAARQAEIADQLEERAAKLRHIGQTDKSNELVYVAGLLRADAIERGEFRWKGGGDAMDND